MTDREKAIVILQRMADDKEEELYICDDEGGSVCVLILEEQNAILAGIEALKGRPHGEWVEVDIKPLPYGGYTCNYQCNKCNYFTKEYHLNFCPNCGAKMSVPERTD